MKNSSDESSMKPRLSRFIRLLGLVTFLGVTASALTGCSVQGQITDMTLNATNTSTAIIQGLAAGSQQTTLVSGYTVSATVGEFGGGAIQQTVNGYSVSTNVQGAIAFSQ